MKNGDMVLILEEGKHYNHTGRIDASEIETGDVLVTDLIFNKTILSNVRWLKLIPKNKKPIREEDLIL